MFDELKSLIFTLFSPDNSLSKNNFGRPFAYTSVQVNADLWPNFLLAHFILGAIILWMYGNEVMSEMLGKLNGTELSFIHELYGMTAIFCLIVNDIYSYEREKILGNRVMNTVRDKRESNECSDGLEAFQKSLKTVNAIIKLEEWRKSNVVEEFDTVQHFLQDASPKAKRMDEAIKRCVLDMNANVLPA